MERISSGPCKAFCGSNNGTREVSWKIVAEAMYGGKPCDKEEKTYEFCMTDKIVPCTGEKYFAGSKLLIQRHKRRNLMKVDRNEGLYGVYYDVNGDRMGEAEIVDTNDYYGL